jgi:hypothetical protein
MRLGWSIPLPGPFRLSGTIWRSKRRRHRKRRTVWHGTLPGVHWQCPHNHARPDLADACAQREAQRRRKALRASLAAKPPVKR